MVALDTPTNFSNVPSPWKKVGAIIFGGSLLTYYALVGIKGKTQAKAGNVAVHKPHPGPDYISTDAMSVANRPAKNANVKGSLPTASKWV